MLKPLTLSLSLALALGASSVSMAGGFLHGNSGCSTCGLASAQGPAPSAQAPIASAQSECGFAAPKKCSLFSGLHNIHFKKPHLFDVQYEWVLKKKLVWAHKGCGGSSCGGECAPAVYPTSQSVVSPQSVVPTGQAYPAGQASYFGGAAAPSYASTPVYSAPAAPAVAAAGDEAPPAPAATEPPPAPAAPAPSIPATPAPNAPQTSLLFSTPSSN